jgi:hypothetical protein
LLCGGRGWSGGPPAGDVQGRAQLAGILAAQRRLLLLGHDPVTGQLPPVQPGHARVLADQGVHPRVGERRLVALVVAVTPETEDVHHHVLGHLLPEIQGQAHDVQDRLRVVAVHVEYRHGGHLGHVGGEEGGAGIPSGGGEADLVVDHDVQCASGVVALDLGQVEDLGHHPLRGEGRITVQDHRQHFLGIGKEIPVAPALQSPGLAFHHPVHRLQVAGIGREGQPQAASGRVAMLPGVAQVVFHVAAAAVLPRSVHVLEQVEDLRRRLSGHLVEDGDAAPVGGAQHHLLQAAPGRRVQQELQRGDEHLRSLQGEALLPDEGPVQEALELLGPDQRLQHAAAPTRVHPLPVPRRINAPQHPVADGPVLDLQDLHAHAPAVGLLQVLQDPPQGARPRREVAHRGQLLVQIRFREAVGAQGELPVSALGPRVQVVGPRLAARQQGVEARVEVADFAVGLQQVLQAALRASGCNRCRCRRDRRRR